jgi:hypothetical protein
MDGVVDIDALPPDRVVGEADIVCVDDSVDMGLGT